MDSFPGIMKDLIAEGYEVFHSTFTGDFGPNGETLSFNDTIEEVMTQVHAINPAYEFDTANTPIEPRDWRTRVARKTDCNAGHDAHARRIRQGILYLRGVSGKCKFRNKGCSRVSCSYNSAILACRDPFEDSSKSYEQSWDAVADYTEGFLGEKWCPTKKINHAQNGGVPIGGKVWDPKGIAVHVGYSKC